MTQQTRWTSISWQTALILNRLRNAQRLREESNDEIRKTEDDERRERAGETKAPRGKLFIAQIKSPVSFVKATGS